jgi:hypothetical protein
MGSTLQVMVIESHPGVAGTAEAELVAAGHQVRRCHDADGPGFPCRGVTGSRDCPLDHPIDVALLVRRGVAPRPTTMEEGVTCALRARVPIVEDGTDLFDPFSELLADRVPPFGDAVTVCEAVARHATEPLEHRVRDAFAPVLTRHGLQPDEVGVQARYDGDVLRLHVTVDRPVTSTLRGLLCITAADATRSAARPRASVEVSFAAPDPD